MSLTRAQHFKASVDRLAEVYKDKPVVLGILSAAARQFADLDTAFVELQTQRFLATAAGRQLDDLGQLLAENRGALGDDDYRAKLQLKLIRIYSEGTADNLLQIFTLLAGTNDVEFKEMFPAAIQLVAVEPASIFSDTFIRQAIEAARAAGINSDYVAKTNGLPAFAFAGDTDPDKAGFGDTGDALVGGRFTSIIR